MTRRYALQRLGVAACLLGIGCSVDFDIQATPQDAAKSFSMDSGPRTMPEAGMDSGPADAAVDTGVLDTGMPEEDAGMEDAAPPPVPLFDCVESLLETQLTTDTTLASDNFSPSCGVGDSRDVAFEFRVPATDYYTVSSVGSAFDTVLTVLDGACDGPELACSNDGDTAQGELVQRFEMGDRVVVVLDGNLGDKGAGALSVTPVSCPRQEVDLDSGILPATFTTSGGPSDFSGDCSPDAQYPDKALRFVAPEAGIYRFSAVSLSYKVALYLIDGPTCGDSILQCSAAAGGGSGGDYPAEVTRELSLGQVLSVVVDGVDGEGPFELNVEKLEGATCPSHDFNDWGSGTPTLKQTDGHLLSGSCVSAGRQYLSGSNGSADHSYLFPIDVPQGGGCSYRVNSSIPLRAYLLKGNTCAGEEVRCAASEEVGTNDYEADLGGFNFNDNGDYILVVESPQDFEVTYGIGVACIL